MVTLAMAMQTMKLLMTQTTLAVSFRHMGSIHQPDLHGVGERRDGEKIEEMGGQDLKYRGRSGRPSVPGIHFNRCLCPGPAQAPGHGMTRY